jgi:hypothetical protein
MELDLADGGRDSNANRLEDLSAGSETLTANGKTLASVFDDGFLQRFEVLLDVRPLEAVAGGLEPSCELFSQDKRQETAEDVAPDGSVPLVKDRPCFKGGFHVPEGIFNTPDIMPL